MTSRTNSGGMYSVKGRCKSCCTKYETAYYDTEKEALNALPDYTEKDIANRKKQG